MAQLHPHLLFCLVVVYAVQMLVNIESGEMVKQCEASFEVGDGFLRFLSFFGFVVEGALAGPLYEQVEVVAEHDVVGMHHYQLLYGSDGL